MDTKSVSDEIAAMYDRFGWIRFVRTGDLKELDAWSTEVTYIDVAVYNAIQAELRRRADDEG
jgi:hypothetical protein